MEPTLDIIAATTVPPTYSWDEGIPNVTYDLLVNNLDDMQTQVPGGETQYVGYAPYFTVLLSSTPFKEEDPTRANSSIYRSYITRQFDFGDYYNSETNISQGNAREFASDEQHFITHTYIMPGIYSIKLTQTIFDVITSSDDNSIFKQEIKNSNDKLPFAWQWYNFRKVSNDSKTNTPATWESARFQQPNQLVWDKTRGECIALNYIDSNIVWQWDNIVSSVTDTSNLTLKLCGAPLTWDDLSCYSPLGATWDFTKAFLRGDLLNINFTSTTRTIEKNLVVKVLEIPPEAYLMAALPEDRTQPLKPVFNFPSPVKVKLTPRFTKCGSFPIEKIIWDLGDGSPLLVQRRWAPTVEAPFYFSGAFEDDEDDPRNYDIIHTYNKNPDSGFCFYPSITAYSSSTSTSDAVSITIGPLNFVSFDARQFKILQNEFTNEGKILLGQVENHTAIWRADK